MLTLHTTDVHGLGVTVEEFDNLIDALIAFDFARHDENTGFLEIWEEGENPVSIKSWLSPLAIEEVEECTSAPPQTSEDWIDSTENVQAPEVGSLRAA